MSTITQVISEFTTDEQPLRTEPDFSLKTDNYHVKLNTVIPQINTWSSQVNTVKDEINTKAEQVANQAVDGGYSQTYINDTFATISDLNTTNTNLNTTNSNLNTTNSNLTALDDEVAVLEKKNLSVAHNITSDADYTLTADENDYGRIEITDTSTVLTGAISIITDNQDSTFLFVNSTAQTLTVKTSAGAGIDVLTGEAYHLFNDGVDIFKSNTRTDSGNVKIVSLGTIYNNNRYVIDNPFGNENYEGCTVRAEVYLNGLWSDTGFDGNAGTGLKGYGTKAHSNLEGIVVQTGNISLVVQSYLAGGGHGYTSTSTSALARVIVIYHGEAK